MILRALSFFLGAVFLIAGVGKLLMMETFATTVAGILAATHTAGLVAATAIVAMEIAGGLALLADYRTRMVSLLFCVMVGAFIWMLSAAILNAEQINCNCFGLTGIALSNTQELLLDLLLFNAFVVLAAGASRRDAMSSGGDGSTGPVEGFAAGGTLLLLEVLLVLSVLSGGTDRGGSTFDAAIDFAEHADARFAARGNGNRALLLMNYADLNCALCLDDFTVLLDSLESLFGENSDRVLLIFKEDQFIRSDSSRHMRRWIAANGIAFPVFVAPDSVFDRASFDKSTALVIDRRNVVLLAERFPLGITKRTVALHLLSFSSGQSQVLSQLNSAGPIRTYGSTSWNSGTLPVSRMRTVTLFPFWGIMTVYVVASRWMFTLPGAAPVVGRRAVTRQTSLPGCTVLTSAYGCRRETSTGMSGNADVKPVPADDAANPNKLAAGLRTMNPFSFASIDPFASELYV